MEHMIMYCAIHAGQPGHCAPLPAMVWHTYVYILYILLTGLAVNMARYCTSVQKYFPEPKARENTAHECNVSPY